ncbi:hypothetical protein MMC26_004492 [Xylographa opegraphella]|nr:hypothetical protein [Xylographa opegraphella]
MTTTLGKRKRRSQLSSPEPPSPSSTGQLRALVQQHFEAKYAPLAPALTNTTTTTPGGPPSAPPSDDEDSAWEGLSSTSSPGPTRVQVISHAPPAGSSKRTDVPRSERRAFMVRSLFPHSQRPRHEIPAI